MGNVSPAGRCEGHLLLNLAAIAAVLADYRHVLLATSRAQLCAGGCAVLGLTTFVIQACFAAAGGEQFHLPLSVVIIVLCLASGLWLLLDLRRGK